MSASAGRPVRARTARAGQAAAAVLATIVGTGGLAACSDDPVGPVGPAATDVQAVTDRIDALEDRIDALEARVGVLEDAPTATEDQPEQDQPSGDGSGVLGDGEALIGQAVTVSGEVTEPVTMADVGASFRIAGERGDPIVVIMATPPAELQVGEAVQVSGRVVRIAEDSFEVDFGIAADQLFEDPDAFFADFGGEVAISADRLEVVPEQVD